MSLGGYASGAAQGLEGSPVPGPSEQAKAKELHLNCHEHFEDTPQLRHNGALA